MLFNFEMGATASNLIINTDIKFSTCSEIVQDITTSPEKKISSLIELHKISNKKNCRFAFKLPIFIIINN